MQQNLLSLRKALFFSLSLAACNSVFSQNDQERAKIRESYNQLLIKKGKGTDFYRSQLNLLELGKKKSDQRVEEYLRNNPGIERSYTRDGKPYFIKDIQPDGTPVIITTKDRQAAESIKANALYPGGSIGSDITGQNMVIGIWDFGPVRATHELFQGRAVQKDTATGDGSHMDHVTGDAIGGDLSSRPEARGVAYSATAWCFNYKLDKAGYSKFGSDGYLVSNHSYGRVNTSEPIWVFGAYNDEARDLDAVLADRPNYLQTWAAGNEQTSNNNYSNKQGYDVITGESASKNILTIGALNADNSMSNYSNWGPTDDGRIKPDICARGTQLTSAGATSDNSYVTEDGTSYASPTISGLALLLQQYYKTLNPTYLDAAGLKGLILHTATDLGQPGPDYKFGWGIANGEAAANTIKNANADLTQFNSESKISKITTNPSVGSSVTYTLKAKGDSPLYASISWSDDAGPEQVQGDGIDPTTSRLVYNFDIKVTAPDGNTTFYPWSGPGMANRTQNSTNVGPNNVDNFERVDIPNPIAGGIYTVTVTKAAGSPAAVRNYTLIATGLQNSTLLPLHLVNFSGAAKANGNLLEWQSGEETNGSYFELEVSSNGTSFTKLATINSRNGNNNSYSYTDATKYATKVYYRLKTIDSDGKATYSSIVAINKNENLLVISLYPSPATDVLNIQSTAGFVGIKGGLYDAVGRYLQSIVINQTTQQLNVKSLEAGVYSIKFENGKTLRFVKK